MKDKLLDVKSESNAEKLKPALLFQSQQGATLVVVKRLPSKWLKWRHLIGCNYFDTMNRCQTVSSAWTHGRL